MGLALANGGSILEPAGFGSLEHGENFKPEATPVAPHLPNCGMQAQRVWIREFNHSLDHWHGSCAQICCLKSPLMVQDTVLPVFQGIVKLRSK